MRGSKKYVKYWILNWIEWLFDLPATVNSEYPSAHFWYCCISRVNVNLKNILPHNVITATHKHKLGLAPWTNQAEFHSPPDVSIFTPKIWSNLISWRVWYLPFRRNKKNCLFLFVLNCAIHAHNMANKPRFFFPWCNFQAQFENYYDEHAH